MALSGLKSALLQDIWRRSFGSHFGSEPGGSGTYVVTSEDSQMEGQQLQGYDAQDALQAVHAVRHFDGAARVFDGFMVISVTNQDGTTLQIKQAFKFHLNLSHTELEHQVFSLFSSKLLSLKAACAADYWQLWGHAEPIYQKNTSF